MTQKEKITDGVYEEVLEKSLLLLQKFANHEE